MKTHTPAITIAMHSLSGTFLSHAGAEEHHHHHASEMQPAGTHTSHSIFNVESIWENQSGYRSPLSQLGNRTQVVAMVYTSCKYACPRILADLRTIQTALSSASPEDLGFCLITIDPERDTVAAFNAYSRKNKLDDDTWTFLRGEPGDILELANLLGVKYKKLPDGEFSHSNIITLLKPNGEIAHQLIGLGADPSELVEAAKRQLHGH